MTSTSFSFSQNFTATRPHGLSGVGEKENYSITLARACGLSRIRPEERSPALVELRRQHSQSGGGGKDISIKLRGV